MMPVAITRCPSAFDGHIYNPTAVEPDRCFYCGEHVLVGATARDRLDTLVAQLLAELKARRPWWCP